jgi:hypothetical protein
MTSYLKVCAGVLSIVLLTSTVVSGQASRPTIIDPIIPGGTLREYLTTKDAVLHVRITHAGRPLVIDAAAEVRQTNPEIAAVPLVAIQYAAQVLAVLKPHARAGVVSEEAQIARLGGEGSWNGVRAVTQSHTPDLVVGAEYFVMVSYNEQWGSLMFTDFDVFQVVNGRLRANHLGKKATYAAELTNRTALEAADILASSQVDSPRKRK